MTLPLTRRAASEQRYAITSATSSGDATRPTACRTSSVTQPVSVTGGYTMLAVIPKSASSAAAAKRVALERALRGAVRHFLGEAVRATGREPDDASPRGAAFDVAACELGDEQRARARVHAEVAIDRVRGDREHRPAEAIDGGRLERVLDPARRIVHQDVDRAELVFREVEEPRRCAHVEQVGLEGDTAGLRVDRIRRGVDAQVRGHARAPRVR